MKSFSYSTTEDFVATNFGPHLLDIVEFLALPVPTIKGSQMKKLQKEGVWAIRVLQPGCETPTDDINFKLIYDDKEKGLNVAMQELIGRLCGRHHPELKTHYSSYFGRRDENGEPFATAVVNRETTKPVRLYLQHLENLIKGLEDDRTDELLGNDELLAQLKGKDAAFQEQEEKIKAMEEKLEAQDKKYKNQEKRIQKKNKEMRDLREELECNDAELDADHDVIEKLRAEKREMQEKIDALAVEVKEYKAALSEAGLFVEEVEVDMEED
jgi:DNA repair exonuclease SbcCD ATPase subunit